MEIACLIEQIKLGDEAAVALFYNKVYDLCFRICYSMARVKGDAPDLFHDLVLFILCNQLKETSFTCEKKFAAWCTKTAVNKAKDFEKARKRKRTRPLEDALWVAVDGDKKQRGAFVYKMIWECIAALPPGCRKVFMMVGEQEYTHEETSEILKITVGASKSQYSRARMLMQKLLSKKGITNGDRL